MADCKEPSNQRLRGCQGGTWNGTNSSRGHLGPGPRVAPTSNQRFSWRPCRKLLLESKEENLRKDCKVKRREQRERVGAHVVKPERQKSSSDKIRVLEPPDFRRLQLRPFKNKTAPAPALAPGEL